MIDTCKAGLPRPRAPCDPHVRPGQRSSDSSRARSGFESIGPEANLRDIARRACVAQGTVHHFPAKQALFSAIITERLRELTSLARLLRAGHAPGEAFTAFLTAAVEHARHNQSLAAVFDVAGGDADMEAASREMNADSRSCLIRPKPKAPSAATSASRTFTRSPTPSSPWTLTRQPATRTAPGSSPSSSTACAPDLNAAPDLARRVPCT
jgi:AcrR family transcriptional regulator